MTEAQWFGMRQPASLWSVVSGKCNTRKPRLFSCACCRRLGDLIADERVRGVIDVSEQFADARATRAELNNAYRRVLRALQAVSRDETASATTDPHWQALAAVTAATSVSAVNLIGAASRVSRAFWSVRRGLLKVEQAAQADLFRDIFGNPFRAVAFDPAWRSEHTVGIASTMFEERDFVAMPVLADALEEAGCVEAGILAHCREPGVHVRGCWVVDLVLAKEEHQSGKSQVSS